MPAFKDFAWSLVATPPSPASSGTSLVVTAGQGSNFPSVPFIATICPAGSLPTNANAEKVLVTVVSTDTFTITRAYDTSSARTVIAGDQIFYGPFAKTLRDALDNSVCDGRLTLTSGTPVTTSDVTGATNIYFTPYKGNRIALFDGTNWFWDTFTEITIPLGTLTNDLPYDVFAYDNAGAVACEILAWTSKTARATALVLQNGVLVKSGATTRRYLGTFHTTATTTTEDSALKRLLWNYYNRVPRPLLRTESVVSWQYTIATWRQANGNTANQVAVVVGYAESMLQLTNALVIANSNAAATPVGISFGEDSTTVPSANVVGGNLQFPGSWAGIMQAVATMNIRPAVGYHFYAAVELSAANASTTFYLRNGLIGGDNEKFITGWIDG
jgi:hypothetical protein